METTTQVGSPRIPSPRSESQILDNKTFFDSLDAHKAHFNGLLESAKTNNARLKYVAQLGNGQASVGLQEIPQGHDFYNLEGSDNIILFYTDRYKDQPLIVKGACANNKDHLPLVFAKVVKERVSSFYFLKWAFDRFSKLLFLRF